MANNKDELNTLSRTKYNCRYHVVFAPKYRRKVFYDTRRLEIIKIFKDLCSYKDVNIIEGEACPDHIHILL